MYYYFKLTTGEYIGCGNEPTAPAGCESRLSPPQPPDPTDEQIINERNASLEAHYDAKAKERRYDNRLTCALRAGYAGPFQAEGVAFATWMDNCNAYAYLAMQDCMAGTRPIPTAEELIAGLPVLVWP